MRATIYQSCRESLLRLPCSLFVKEPRTIFDRVKKQQQFGASGEAFKSGAKAPQEGGGRQETISRQTGTTAEKQTGQTSTVRAREYPEGRENMLDPQCFPVYDEDEGASLEYTTYGINAQSGAGSLVSFEAEAEPRREDEFSHHNNNNSDGFPEYTPDDDSPQEEDMGLQGGLRFKRQGLDTGRRRSGGGGVSRKKESSSLFDEASKTNKHVGAKFGSVGNGVRPGPWTKKSMQSQRGPQQGSMQRAKGGRGIVLSPNPLLSRPPQRWEEEQRIIGMSRAESPQSTRRVGHKGNISGQRNVRQGKGASSKGASGFEAGPDGEEEDAYDAYEVGNRNNYETPRGVAMDFDTGDFNSSARSGGKSSSGYGNKGGHKGAKGRSKSAQRNRGDQRRGDEEGQRDQLGQGGKGKGGRFNSGYGEWDHHQRNQGNSGYRGNIDDGSGAKGGRVGSGSNQGKGNRQESYGRQKWERHGEYGSKRRSLDDSRGYPGTRGGPQSDQQGNYYGKGGSMNSSYGGKSGGMYGEGLKGGSMGTSGRGGRGMQMPRKDGFEPQSMKISPGSSIHDPPSHEETAAHLVSLRPEERMDVIREMDPADTAGCLNQMSFEDKESTLSQMEPRDRAHILQLMSVQEREDSRASGYLQTKAINAELLPGDWVSTVRCHWLLIPFH